MNGLIREPFRKRMSHFDFINLFFDQKNRRFFDIYEADMLNESDIASFIAPNGAMQKTSDGGFILGIRNARIYSFCDKWVVFYSNVPLRVRTQEKAKDDGYIVVYSRISNTLQNDLTYHVSFDGHLPCWRY